MKLKRCAGPDPAAGTAEFAIETGKSLAHPIAAQATLIYRERRLPGAGRDALALRQFQLEADGRGPSPAEIAIPRPDLQKRIAEFLDDHLKSAIERMARF